MKYLNKIVFTNGCFDILHRGHVEYLKRAKELGDYLIVGLNSDNSVTRLKGKPRPFVSESDRKYIIENLKPVDEVIIFDEDTPYELIKKIKPNILVKGGDYIISTVVGRDLVDEVVIFNLIEGRSTTNIVHKIKNN